MFTLFRTHESLENRDIKPPNETGLINMIQKIMNINMNMDFGEKNNM